MTNVLSFKVIIIQDEDGVFVADCPAIPGCHSQGKTYEEAVTHIEEAIKLCLSVSQEDEQYRDTIDFPQKNAPGFVGIRDVFVPTPQFV